MEHVAGCVGVWYTCVPESEGLPPNQASVTNYSVCVLRDPPRSISGNPDGQLCFLPLLPASPPFLLKKMCWYIKTSRMERVKLARECVIRPPRCSMQLCRALHLSGLESPTSPIIFLLLFWSFQFLEFSSVASFKAVVLVWRVIYSIQRDDNNNPTDVF